MDPRDPQDKIMQIDEREARTRDRGKGHGRGDPEQDAGRRGRRALQGNPV